MLALHSPLIYITILASFVDAELLFAQVFMHHGKKTKKEFTIFPSDPPDLKPKSNNSYEIGELSNEGTWGAYTVGSNLRSAYGHLLDYKYTPSKLYVLSRTIHRSVASAQLMLASFLPPVDEQIWNPDLLWQPIPIITNEILDHASAEVLFSCPSLGDQLLSSGVYEPIFRSFSNTTDFLEQHTGKNISNIFVLQDVIGAVLGRYHGRDTIQAPDWLNKNLADALDWQYSQLNSKVYSAFLEDIGGWHFDQLVSGMNDTLQKKTTYKMIIYSVHEANAVIMTDYLRIGKIWTRLPSVSSYFAFELHISGNDHFVKIYSHDKLNGTKEELFLKDCPSPCTFNRFSKLPFKRVTSEQWWQICKGGSNFTQPDCSFGIVLTGVLTLLATLLVTCAFSFFCSHNANKRRLRSNNGETKTLL